MHEVEVKVEISNPDEIIARLEERGFVLGKSVLQKDTVYTPKGVPIPVPLNTRVLRIREQGGKALLTLKIPKVNQLDCVERELGVGSPAEMEAIILDLGFEKASYVEKLRRKSRVGEIELCVDSVTDLGEYIEVEKIVQDGAEGGVQQELLAFLRTLGVDEKRQVFDGYDILLAKKQALKPE